jgi:hypothetical protein
MSLRTNLAVVTVDDPRLMPAFDQMRRRGALKRPLLVATPPITSLSGVENVKEPTAASLALATELIARYRNVATERRPLLVRDVAFVFDDYADVAAAVCDASNKQSVPRKMPDRWSPSTVEIEKVCSAFRKTKFPGYGSTDEDDPLVYPSFWRPSLERCDGYHAMIADPDVPERGYRGKQWARDMLAICWTGDKRAHQAALAVLADKESTHSEKTRAGMLLARVREAITAANGV